MKLTRNRVDSDTRSPGVAVWASILTGGGQARRNVGIHRAIASAATSGPTGRFRRLGGVRVTEALYEAVHGRVTDLLPILTPGIAYGRHDLCGQAFIARLAPGRRQQVDVCLADLAARGALPLEPVLEEADAPPRYRLKYCAGNGLSQSAAALSLLDVNPAFEG